MKIKAIIMTLLMCASTHSQATVIYQAFDEPFKKLEEKLPRLKELGYSYIQISPPQKSLPAQEWWARYQPLDHSKIEGFLGSEEELKDLIAATHDLDLKIIVDAVLNHMADYALNSQGLSYAQFDKNDFHFYDTRPCIKNYFDRFQVTHFWLCGSTPNSGLPDLDTSSPKVRSVLYQYLDKLISLGVDGFRFDAMKHIEPEFWAFLMPKIENRGLYSYGEVIGQTLEESYLYTPFAEITDFHLLSLMLRTFTWGGDLRNLHDPVKSGQALNKPSVVFARNHDTAMHPGFYNFTDYTDAMLANALILGRGEGTISIYRDDFQHPFVTAGIQFRNQTADEPLKILPVEQICGPQDSCDPRTLLILARGNSHLMILNTSNQPLHLSLANLKGFDVGCYQDFQSKNQWSYRNQSLSVNSQQRTLDTIKIHGRSPTFLGKISSQFCNETNSVN